MSYSQVRYKVRPAGEDPEADAQQMSGEAAAASADLNTKIKQTLTVIMDTIDKQEDTDETKVPGLLKALLDACSDYAGGTQEQAATKTARSALDWVRGYKVQ